jgi:hypothetical protein
LIGMRLVGFGGTLAWMAALLLAGCGGKSFADAGDERRDPLEDLLDGESPTTTPDDGASPTAPGAGGAGAAAECVRREDPDANSEPWREACESLAMVVSDFELVDESGDGRLSPGESAGLSVMLRETSGYDYYRYPGVEFSADDPRVTFGPYGSGSYLYGMHGCDSGRMSVTVSFGADLMPGTAVVLTAQPAALHQACGASGQSISVIVE